MSYELNGPYFTLSSGRKLPAIGLGLWKIPTDVAKEQVYHALKIGYRGLDGAQVYGNEKEAGEGLNQAISEGIVKREDVFITTKVWNTFHSPDHVQESINRSLKDWGVDYFDLILIHWPLALKYVDPKIKYPTYFYGANESAKKVEFEDVPLYKTWEALELLVSKGIAKSIGLSNYTPALVNDVLRYSKIKPEVLQIELHPYLTQSRFQKYLKINNIQITSYSTFGPQSFLELGFKEAENATKLFDDDLILKISKKYSKTPAQVILRWATQSGLAVNPKSNHKERLLENLESYKFDLTNDELEEINGLNRNLRFNQALFPGDEHLFPLFD